MFVLFSCDATLFIVLCYIAQSCLTFCNPMDSSPPGSSVHGIPQARILEWVAISYSGDLPDPGIKPTSPSLADGFFTSKPLGKQCLLVRLFKKVYSFNTYLLVLLWVRPRATCSGGWIQGSTLSCSQHDSPAADSWLWTANITDSALSE